MGKDHHTLEKRRWSGWPLMDESPHGYVLAASSEPSVSLEYCAAMFRKQSIRECHGSRAKRVLHAAAKHGNSERQPLRTMGPCLLCVTPLPIDDSACEPVYAEHGHAPY
jgi:hypothetical protein